MKDCNTDWKAALRSLLFLRKLLCGDLNRENTGNTLITLKQRSFKFCHNMIPIKPNLMLSKICLAMFQQATSVLMNFPVKKDAGLNFVMIVTCL
nr:MAG TPA: hypothetical protein [Caudoviricetes sp.]